MKTVYANPDQAWMQKPHVEPKAHLFDEQRQMSSCDQQCTPHSTAVMLCPLAPAFCWHHHQTSAWQKDAVRINHVITHTSRTMPMSHSYEHRVSLYFQKPRCCAKIFRNLSLLIGINKDIFAHWPSTDINGVMIPSFIVGHSAYPD